MERDKEKFNSREGNKKISLLLVLKALEQMSDESHPIKQITLAKMVNDFGGVLNLKIWCDRKTVGRHLKLLISVGYNIVTVKGKGYYLECNKLKNQERETIIELIKTSSLSEDEKKQLISKILSQQNNINKERLFKILDVKSKDQR